MRLKADQLKAALKNKLLPVYLLSGDEPLQLAEAADEIRRAARQAGYIREVLSIETGSEWPQLRQQSESLSIFADKTLLDVRLAAGKVGVEGSKALIGYCQQLPGDTLLLISSDKLDSSAQKSQWFQAIDKCGAVVQVWPLQGAELIDWLQRRAAGKGMKLDGEAVKILAGRVEGNLLAAAQEIEKLYILHGATTIHRNSVDELVADNARFDVFKLTDALLQGKLNRAVKILHGLQAEDVAAPVILWALSREIRLLMAIQQVGHQPAIYKKYQSFDRRKPLIDEALSRLRPADLQRLLRLCTDIDQQIKGERAGDCWETIFSLCCSFTNPALQPRPVCP